MEIALVMLIMAVALFLFISERYPGALIAMMVAGVLMLVAVAARWLPWIHADRWITPDEGVSGFSNPATITVAAMFVLSAGLQATGAVAWLGPGLARLARWPSALLLVLLVVVSVVSAFIHSTAAVAIFLPVALAASARGGPAPSRLLIPLSYAAQFGGVSTLIGTSTNLLANAISQQAGHGAFGFFEFTPLGAILTAVGIGYLLTVGRWLLPDRPGRGLMQTFQVADYVSELRVPAESPLIGRTARETRFGEGQRAYLLAILRGGQTFPFPPDTPVAAGDLLLVQAPAQELFALRDRWKLASEPESRLDNETLEKRNLHLAEAVVAPRSRLIGQTVRETDFRRRFGCLVLGVQTRHAGAAGRPGAVRLTAGDALLLLGTREQLARRPGVPDLLLLDRVEDPSPRRGKALLAVVIMGTVVALTALNLLPILVSSLFGCITLVATRCLSLEEAYEAIDWKVIFLLGGMLPLGLAMDKSGAATLLADGVAALARALGPGAGLAVLYLATALLTEFMSHNATVVILAPVALAAAARLQIDPRPLLVAVCFAASTTFCTPIGYQTNAMVQHPGGYRFTDYLKVGLPLNVIFWALSVYFIPRLWPF